MTVAATWDDLANVIALTGDANHIHIPGSPYEWRHPYIPISETAAKSHGGGKVPKGWKAPGGSGAGKAPSLESLAAKHGMRTMKDNYGTLLLPKGGGIVSPVLRERDGHLQTVNGEDVDPHEADAYLAAYKKNPDALSTGLLDKVRSSPGEPPHAPSAAAPAKITQRDLTKIRKQTGLDMGHPDAYRLGAAKPDYAEALGHLAAGRNDEAQAAMDRMVTRAQGMKGPEGKRTAAAAVSMRDKVRAGLSKPAVSAPAPKPGTVSAPNLTPGVDPEWKQTMDAMAAKERAAGISNARAMDRSHALHEARAMHMREATGGITFPHPGDLGGHPGDNGAWQASELFARGDLRGAAAALDRQAAGETSRARAAKNSKLAAQLRATPLKPTLPSLAKVPGTQQPDKSFTALDHNGNEYQVRLRPVSLGKSEVTVSRGGRSATAPAGDNPERTARALAARMAPATEAEIRDAENAVVRGQMLTPRQQEVLRQSNDALTAQASKQVQAAKGKTVQAAYSWGDLGSVIDLAVGTPVKAPAAKASPARLPGKPPAVPPVPGPSRRGRQVPLTPMRQAAAKSMRKLAASVQESHPDMTVHDHLRDAARTLESGQEEASQRHLRAAMFALTPQSLMRNGLHTDEHHMAARDVMHGVHRHLLLVKDITDVAAKNQAAIRRLGGEDDTAPRPEPDPNNGYGPGALAQKPTARQPGGDRALNAPARSSSGGSDPAVADPDGPQPKGSKQFAYGWGDLSALIEMANRPETVDLVGPAGYVHGWIYEGGPGLPSVASHNAKLRAKGVTPPTKARPALTSKPPSAKMAPKAVASRPAAVKAPGRPAVPSPAKAAAPASGAPAVKALHGDAAYGHVAEPAGKKERDAADYYSVASGRLNPALRNGTALADKTDKAQLRNLEGAFAKAQPTTAHIVAYRGTTGALFGKGDATGTHFVDKGFTSVSTDQRQAGMFGSESDPALMEIHVPAGSRVVKPGAAGHYSAGDEAEKELVLNHGGHYEITGDQMVNDPQLGMIRKLTATYRGPA